MKIFQDEQMGARTPPEFEEEVIVFIRMDVLLPESEECSLNRNAHGVTTYTKEELEKWK